jgi:hypothetical protein
MKVVGNVLLRFHYPLLHPANASAIIILVLKYSNHSGAILDHNARSFEVSLPFFNNNIRAPSTFQ